MARSITDAPSQTDNGPSFQVFSQHTREITVALVKKAEADSVVQHAYKRAKSAGINIQEMKAALKAKKLDVEQVSLNLRDFQQYLAWLDVKVGTQAQMFAVVPPPEEGVKEMRVDDAHQAGYDAGLANQDMSACPFRPGEELHAAWARGFHRGVAFMEGRSGDEPKIEKVSARARGSRTAKAATAPKDRVVVLADRQHGGRRKVKVPAEVPEVSPGPGQDQSDGEEAGAAPALH